MSRIGYFITNLQRIADEFMSPAAELMREDDSFTPLMKGYMPQKLLQMISLNSRGETIKQLRFLEICFPYSVLLVLYWY
jgi:hypothetical protein